MSMSPYRLALLLSLAAAPALAQADPAPVPPPPDSAVAREPAPRADSTAATLPAALLGEWSCRRPTTEYEPPFVFALREGGRWADRSTSRAIVARWVWDGTTLQLLRAGGEALHVLRATEGRFVGEGGLSCERTGDGAGSTGRAPQGRLLPG